MTALEFIDKLRARPEEDRRRIAFWTSTGVTLLIAVIWLASMGTLSGGAKTQVAAVEVAAGPVKSSADGNEVNWWSENKQRIITGWKRITNQK